jgi:hypothetical protein
MFTTPSTFMYGMNVKMKLVPRTTALDDLFPNIEDFIVQSKPFDTADEAVASAKGIMNDLTEQINSVSDTKYKHFLEINPKIGGVETISKEWGVHDIAKLWIVPETANLQSNEAITALGVAQIVEVQSAPVLTS